MFLTSKPTVINLHFPHFILQFYLTRQTYCSHCGHDELISHDGLISPDGLLSQDGIIPQEGPISHDEMTSIEGMTSHEGLISHDGLTYDIILLFKTYFY